MIDWQAARDGYVSRFGAVYGFEEVTAPDRALTAAEIDDDDDDDLMSVKRRVRFFMLTCWSDEVPGAPVTYASFGAAHGGAGNELFLTAAAPYSPFEQAVSDLAERVPRDVAPLSVVSHEVRLTSFDAMLVLPPEDGFALGEVDGVLRRALRLVPITPAERRLAASDPERLLALLREAGALVADPLRACVVEPAKDKRRRANAVRLLDDHRRTAGNSAERHETLVQLNAPEAIIEIARKLVQKKQAMLTHLEARVPALLGDPGALDLLDPEALGERIAATLTRVMSSSVEPYRGLLPPRIVQVLRPFMLLVLTTHPVIYPIVYSAAVGDGEEPEEDDAEGIHAADLFVETTVARLAMSFPAANRQRLAARGEEIAEEARRTFDDDGDGLPWKVYAWSAIVPALLLAAADLGTEHGPAIEEALRHAVSLVSNVDDEPSFEAGGAPLRLAKIISAMSKGFYRDYLRIAREAVREGAAGG